MRGDNEKWSRVTGRRRARRSRDRVSVVGTVGALGLVLASLSAGASATVEVRGDAGNCGPYQCFYIAKDFLTSVPSPQIGQVATVPLARTAIGPAAGGPSMLIGLDNGPRAFWAASDAYAQGRSGLVGGVRTGNVFNFAHWQYVDELYYYLHDTVSVPPTQWVNAAHRNGAGVLGTVTGDCGICGREASMLFNSANYQATAQQLYAYAAAYGFDGWMIDMEAGFDPTPHVLAAVRLMTQMVLPDGARMRVAVYQAGEPVLTDLLPYVQAGAQWQADYSSDLAAPSRTYQNLVHAGLRRLNLQAFWSSYVYSGDYRTGCPQGPQITETQIWNGNTDSECLSTASLFVNQRAIAPSMPGGPPYYTSTSLFAPGWTFLGGLPNPQPNQVPSGPASRARVHAADDALWVGKNVTYKGPACSRSGPNNAVSALVTPRSVVGSLPFDTNFSEGEGDVYDVAGRAVSNTQWNDLTAQDILPTWSCTLTGQATATPVYATAGNHDAYNGGSSLDLSTGSSGLVSLYSARIPVSNTQQPTLALSYKPVSGPPPVVRITFTDGSTWNWNAQATGSGWLSAMTSVPAQGKTIANIAVGLPRAGKVLLGALRIYDKAADSIPALIPATSATASLTWSAPRSPAISRYNLYQAVGSCYRFLGPAFTTTYSLANSMYPVASPAGSYLIQPVSAAGSLSPVSPICPLS